MKLNLDFYHEKKEKITKEEQKIKEYIEKYQETKYEQNFDGKIEFEELYNLSDASQNILNWYPFQKQDNILEIGGDFGQRTKTFLNLANYVTTIEPNLIKAKSIAKRYENYDNLEIIAGNLKDIKLNQKYDYIILIDVIARLQEVSGMQISLFKLVSSLLPYLKENGKFLIALDNKFGLRYFSGNEDYILNKKFQNIIGYHNEEKQIETFTKKKIEQEIKSLGLNVNFYYPLPDYRIPNVIFSDSNLPKYNSIDKYNPYYTKKATIIFNELDVFREILQDDENMFEFFANSFLLEISKQKIPIKYKYISFNNIRKEEYRLITKIADDFVEKQAVNEKAKKHLKSIGNNISLLKEQKIHVLDKQEDEKIISKYIDQEMLLSNVITNYLQKENTDKLYEIINDYINLLKKGSYKEDNYKNTVFAKYEIEVEDNLLKTMHFQKKGLWDMTFKNCFLIDNEFYFFDQEWSEDNLPIEYILYRSILYTISLRRFINIHVLFEKYDLIKYLEIFEKLDLKLQQEVRDDRIWDFYNQNKYFDIDATKQELENVNIRSFAQQEYIKNLQMEKEALEKEYANYKNSVEQRFVNKVKKKVKGFLNRKRK